MSTERQRKMAAAHARVKYNVDHGKLRKPKSCWLCGGQRFIDAHHWDYDYPLEIVWLCRTCHSRTHHKTDMVERLRKIATRWANLDNTVYNEPDDLFFAHKYRLFGVKAGEYEA